MTQLGAPTNETGEQNGKAKAPMPPHLKATGNKVFCRGCSNNWDNAQSIPCWTRGCKFREHPDYFHECATKEPRYRSALTWRGFRDRYPQGPFPASFLRWEEFDKTRAPKRPRDESQRP
jgi:hypothetical protein